LMSHRQASCSISARAWVRDHGLQELVKTPKMRAMLKAAEKLRPQKQPRLFHARYNRQRLYEEVWAEPAHLVAKRYGVSDAAIAKG